MPPVQPPPQALATRAEGTSQRYRGRMASGLSVTLSIPFSEAVAATLSTLAGDPRAERALDSLAQ